MRRSEAEDAGGLTPVKDRTIFLLQSILLKK